MDRPLYEFYECDDLVWVRWLSSCYCRKNTNIQSNRRCSGIEIPIHPLDLTQVFTTHNIKTGENHTFCTSSGFQVIDATSLTADGDDYLYLGDVLLKNAYTS